MGANTTGGALSGAGAGAATGAMVGSVVPGIGTAIGAVAGAVIGGIGGAVQGAFADKSAAYMRKANKLKYETDVRNAALARRDMMRDFRMNRAMQLASAFAEAGNASSSTVQSALGSYQSQFQGNVGMFDWSAGHQRKINMFRKKAGKAAETSAMIGAASQAIMSVGSLYAGGLAQSKGFDSISHMANSNAVNAGYQSMLPAMNNASIGNGVQLGAYTPMVVRGG